MVKIIETDVVVVGCGPVGALTANFLGQYGVQTMVLERETTEHGQPRAFSCDDEALRIYQQVGLVEQLRLDMVTADYIDYSGVGGRIFAEIFPPNARQDSGYPILNFFYQPKLERVLRDGMARFSSVSLHLGHEVVALEQDTHGVNLTVRDHTTETTKHIRAQYVLGSDGSHSMVRRLAGIGLTGDSSPESWLAVSGFVTDDMLRLKHTRFVCDPQRPAFVAYGAANDFRMEFMLMPGETRQEMEQPATIRRLISPYVDPDQIRINRAVVYKFHNTQADQWQAGRVLLLGDAAHQMPPFMGQGLVSGLRDVSNLSWKLALVLRGIADPSLLASYEVERQAHVKAMADISVKMGHIFMTHHPYLAQLRDRLFLTLNRIPRARRFISNFEFKPLPLYEQGAFVRQGRRGGAAGHLFPQTLITTEAGQQRMSDAVLGRGFAIVGLNVDPRSIMPGRDEAVWQQLSVNWVAILAPGQKLASKLAGTQVIYDDSGKLTAWFKQHHASIAIIRPDHFVFAAGPMEHTADLAQATKAAFTTYPVVYRRQAQLAPQPL